MVDLLEHQGKHLLREAGIAVPRGTLVSSPADAAHAAERLGGRVVCKAQVPAGRRGKAGAVQLVTSPAEAHDIATRLFGSDVGGHRVESLLVEEAVDIAAELYAAILNDPVSKGPLVLLSADGGMEIEEVSATRPERLHKLAVDIRTGLEPNAALTLVRRSALPTDVADPVAAALTRLYRVYRDTDASLVEVNPLVLTEAGDVVAIDAKVSIDTAAAPRQQHTLDTLPGVLPIEPGTDLEREAARLGLQFIELDGDVGVLANGAGLTMTTVDAISHFGGKPANFLEIGGDAYTKATPALRLVLSNPNVRSLLVNFCGAFARTDVMTEGVLNAIDELRPEIPIAFTIHGTGEREAIALVRDRLGITPHDQMDDAVRAAVTAARERQEVAS
ncbi:MAG: succinate--CoA ligase [Actinophytocola sp.]|nr:succinate--CoA ligase [Actinophytocola sp.]